MSLREVIEVWQGEPLEPLLWRLYIKEDMTMPEIADYLHVSKGVVHKWLHEFGINKQPELWKK